MTKTFISTAVALGCLGTLVSCSHIDKYRGTLSYLSTTKTYTSSQGEVRTVTAEELKGCPVGEKKVTGHSYGFAMMGLETLLCICATPPSLQSAYEDALKKAPGAIGLKNARIMYRETAFEWLLFLLHVYTSGRLEVVGTPVYGK